MRARFDFTASIEFFAKEVGVVTQTVSGSVIAIGDKSRLDALVARCQSFNLSVTAPFKPPPSFVSYSNTLVAVAFEPMGWIDVTIPSEVKP